MFRFLGAHPEIFPSRVKEAYYFMPANKRSLEDYLSLFAEATDERWLLDGSPLYLLSADTPHLIREFSPESRAIVMVRNPVDLIRSQHTLNRLQQRERNDLPTALEATDLYWDVARCGQQLERLLAVFPREDVHIVVHDDFLADNAAEYRRVLEFLDIDPGFAPRFSTVNPSREARMDAVQRTLWRDGGAARVAARLVLPPRVREKGWRAISRLNAHRRPRPPLDDDLAESIRRRLEPDVELLSNLLDRDLVSLWGR